MNIIPGVVLRDMQALNRLIASKGGSKVKISSKTYLIDTSLMITLINDEDARKTFEVIREALLSSGFKHYQFPATDNLNELGRSANSINSQEAVGEGAQSYLKSICLMVMRELRGRLLFWKSSLSQ